MIFGLLTIFCAVFLLCTVLAFPIVAAKKQPLGIAVLGAFLLTGLPAGAMVWQITRPEGLPVREALKAGVTNEGLRTYGHPIEHRAEVAICLTAYAAVLVGCLSAAATFAVARKTRPQSLA